jgi:hypothetical protein
MENMPIVPVYTEDEQKRLDKKNVEKEEKYTSDVESTVEFISNILKKDGVYTETYQLNDRNEIDRDTVITENAGRTILEMVKTVDISTEGLGNLAADIMKKDKNINLTATVEDGKLILKFENKFRVGVLVNWVSQDTIMWDTPKKINRIDGEYAFVEGSTTGVPVSQLELAA